MRDERSSVFYLIVIVLFSILPVFGRLGESILTAVSDPLGDLEGDGFVIIGVLNVEVTVTSCFV